MKASLLTMWCAHVLWREFVGEQQKQAGLLYHVVASEEGVDGIKVVVEELRHTVDDVEGDGLQDTHHLHVFACGITGEKKRLQSGCQNSRSHLCGRSSEAAHLYALEGSGFTQAASKKNRGSWGVNRLLLTDEHWKYDKIINSLQTIPALQHTGMFHSISLDF